MDFHKVLKLVLCFLEGSKTNIFLLAIFFLITAKLKFKLLFVEYLNERLTGKKMRLYQLAHEYQQSDAY